MHVVIAPTPIAGLTSSAAAEVMARVWGESAPGDVVTTVPLASDGTGLAALAATAKPAYAVGPAAEVVAVTVRGPEGAAVPATLTIVEVGGGRTVYLNGSDAVGPHLASDVQGAALEGTSAGLAELIVAAAAAGATRVIVGLEGGVALDGGAGLLAALGVEPAGALSRGGLALAAIEQVDADSLRRARERFKGIDLVVATDLDLPLLGFHGTAATQGGDLGLPASDTQALEAALGRFVDATTAALGQRDLLTGRPRRLDREPGAGAGGGAAHGLMLLGARVQEASPEILQVADLSTHLADADLVVTTCDRFDWDRVRRGVIRAVADEAAACAIPALVVATECLVGRREVMGMGLAGSHALAERPDQAEAVQRDPEGALAERTARLARTWSPRR
ncbi:MAG TPA: glycerate kinase [Phycicoccus sp.]|nr:glycerate kinase [Phycicoccus sp.]HQH06766.1 glycerate kinase [Phycicoccus sp.]HQV90890.1 glycerate kinase [Phycicoccus sp.]HQY95387.1 glycerate kinase [Phycicoccus sp.]HRA43489.1 glycerate kinase [Phycicoccus sp.]